MIKYLQQRKTVSVGFMNNINFKGLKKIYEKVKAEEDLKVY